MGRTARSRGRPAPAARPIEELGEAAFVVAEAPPTPPTCRGARVCPTSRLAPRGVFLLLRRSPSGRRAARPLRPLRTHTWDLRAPPSQRACCARGRCQPRPRLGGAARARRAADAGGERERRRPASHGGGRGGGWPTPSQHVERRVAVAASGRERSRARRSCARSAWLTPSSTRTSRRARSRRPPPLPREGIGEDCDKSAEDRQGFWDKSGAQAPAAQHGAPGAPPDARGARTRDSPRSEDALPRRAVRAGRRRRAAARAPPPRAAARGARDPADVDDDVLRAVVAVWGRGGGRRPRAHAAERLHRAGGRAHACACVLKAEPEGAPLPAIANGAAESADAAAARARAPAPGALPARGRSPTCRRSRSGTPTRRRCRTSAAAARCAARAGTLPSSAPPALPAAAVRTGRSASRSRRPPPARASAAPRSRRASSTPAGASASSPSPYKPSSHGKPSCSHPPPTPPTAARPPAATAPTSAAAAKTARGAERPRRRARRLRTTRAGRCSSSGRRPTSPAGGRSIDGLGWWSTRGRWSACTRGQRRRAAARRRRRARSWQSGALVGRAWSVRVARCWLWQALGRWGAVALLPTAPQPARVGASLQDAAQWRDDDGVAAATRAVVRECAGSDHWPPELLAASAPLPRSYAQAARRRYGRPAAARTTCARPRGLVFATPTHFCVHLVGDRGGCATRSTPAAAPSPPSTSTSRPPRRVHRPDGRRRRRASGSSRPPTPAPAAATRRACGSAATLRALRARCVHRPASRAHAGCGTSRRRADGVGGAIHIGTTPPEARAVVAGDGGGADGIGRALGVRDGSLSPTPSALACRTRMAPAGPTIRRWRRAPAAAALGADCRRAVRRPLPRADHGDALRRINAEQYEADVDIGGDGARAAAATRHQRHQRVANAPGTSREKADPPEATLPAKPMISTRRDERRAVAALARDARGALVDASAANAPPRRRARGGPMRRCTPLAAHGSITTSTPDADGSANGPRRALRMNHDLQRRA